MMKFFSSCVLMVLLFSAAQGQSVSDTSFVKVAARNTARIYNEFITVHSGLINGSEYAEPPYNDSQFPFYQQLDWLSGSVVYNDELYTGVSLMYDVSSDNLVAENPNNGQEIQLVKAKVSSFTIDGDEFVNMRLQQLAGLPQEGFYQILYDGKSTVLVKHVKAFEEKIENSQLVYYYVEKKRFYVQAGENYVRVSRKGDILKLFRDRKDEVRNYMRKNKIKVSKHNPSSFALLAEYYDTL